MTREFPVGPAPHVPAPTSVRGVMGKVLVALVPALVAHVVVSGPGVLVQVLLAVAFAVALEAAMLRARGVRLAPYLGDLSAVVTAVLFALAIPPLAPWWIALVAMIAAIVVAKQLYGGIGFNVFNPAMVGYAVVLVCFPLEMSRWPVPAQWPDGATLLAAIAGGGAGVPWDTVAQATPLDRIRTVAIDGSGSLSDVLSDPAFGSVAGRGFEWIALAYAAGGLWLLRERVIHWHVPVAVLGGALAVALPFWLADVDRYPSPLLEVGSGALVFGAFFIATDPVTGCTTPRGRLVFGAGVGALTVLIRRFGAYPDGLAFAILVFNAAAPLLDRYTKPRVYGTPR